MFFGNSTVISKQFHKFRQVLSHFFHRFDFEVLHIFSIYIQWTKSLLEFRRSKSRISLDCHSGTNNVRFSICVTQVCMRLVICSGHHKCKPKKIRWNRAFDFDTFKQRMINMDIILRHLSTVFSICMESYYFNNILAFLLLFLLQIKIFATC